MADEYTIPDSHSPAYDPWEKDALDPVHDYKFISYVTTPNGNTYIIKDEVARQGIQSAFRQIDTLSGGSVTLIGVATTATPIQDNSTINPIIIESGGSTQSVAVVNGNLAFYGKKEFVWSQPTTAVQGKWIELGDSSDLGNFSLADTGAATVTIPNLSVSAGTFTGSQSNVTIFAGSSTGTYTPAGTVGTTVTGGATTMTGVFTPAGNVSVTTATTKQADVTISTAAAGSGTPANYTPGGSISQATFSGNALTSTGPYTPAGTIVTTTASATLPVTTASGTTTYTPAGTVSNPTISLATAGSTANITPITGLNSVVTNLVATAPTTQTIARDLTYYDVQNETLSLYHISSTTGYAVSTGTAIKVKTGDPSYSASSPTFTGTGVRLEAKGGNFVTDASFSGTSATISVSGTPTGSVSTQTFTGTGVHFKGQVTVPDTFSGSFSGTQGDVKVSGTPNIASAASTFSGTSVNLSGRTTAAGSVSATTATGTTAAITVYPVLPQS